MSNLDYPPTQPVVQPHVNVNVAGPTIAIMQHGSTGPGIIARIIWFLCIGLWIGSIMIPIGYLLCCTIVGLPLGLAILNNLPRMMTLRAPTTSTRIRTQGLATTIDMGMRAKQYPFLVRAVYFLVIGLALTAIWLTVAWVCAIFWWATLGLSLGLAFWMFDRVPAVLTLRVN